MSAVGSPSTATRSASRPAFTLPILSSRCRATAATLVAEAGDTLWLQSKLNAESIAAGAVVSVLLPTQLLSPGVYQITLTGTSRRPGLDAVVTYAFRVDAS